VPVEDVPVVLTEVASEQTRLAAVQTALAARLATRTTSPVSAKHRVCDDLLKVEEAARRLGMSPTWVYKNAARLPFTHRIGRRTVRFSAAGIDRYLTKHRSS
jgi:predicted DNA-binding transcriptional regulator AlpA